MISLGLLLAAAAGIPAQEETYRDPGMKTIVQVAIVCGDIEATSKRWANLLGVAQPKITLTRPGREVKVTYRGRPSEGRVKLAFIRMGQVVLELMEPVGGDTSWKEYLDKHGEGVQHIGFQVTDLEKTVATLKSLGMPELHRGRYDNDNGTYVYFDSQPSLGVTVELLHSDPPAKRE
ncbi:MAG: VOC family protein [Acidobacteriota bacterium]